MRYEKAKAYQLRITGKSYNEITKSLKIPKSTLSGWFSGLSLSEEAQKRLKVRVSAASLRGLLARNKNQTRLAQVRAQETREKSAKSVRELSKRDLLMLGCALYWAEGYKRPIIRNGSPRTYHRVSLTNSNPELIGIFLRFLREICEVSDDKIIANVRTFRHQDPTYILDFWQKICKIPYSNFRKTIQTISISSQRRKPFNSLPYGVMQISVNSTDLFHRIMGLISGIAKNR